MRTSPASLLFLTLFLAVPDLADAQQPAAAETVVAERHEIINENEHHYVGKVEMELNDTKLYADDVRFYVDQDRAVATGNVVFRQGNSQIAADRADFNTNTRLGTFYSASGFATVQPPRRQGGVGVVTPPPVPGQETVVLFFGETVEKIGPRKYRIVEGGFTTCVQPTPRWDFHADTIVLNLDHYTLLRNVVMKVKGVPLLYLPAIYYPTKRDDRATGFLLPTYGRSTLRGQSLSNAFFWAIDRSQDATFMHDWFSKTGQGVGSEYRYNFGGGSDGDIRTYFLNEHATTTDGLQTGAAKRTYRINASASELLPWRLRARASVDYFSDIVTNQTFNTNINDASNSRRTFGGFVSGGWAGYTLNGTLQQTEIFSSQTNSSKIGSWPRIAVTRNERPIPNTPFYVAASGEYAHLLNEIRTETTGLDRSLMRFDVNPQLRFPFNRWQWFTVNSTASWRDTYYSRSYRVDPAANAPARDPLTDQPIILGDNLNRQYFTLQSHVTGPVFNRVWDTPENGYAEKFKHSIEPFATVMRASAIDNYAAIIPLEGTDQIVGGVTQYTYGVINRFYAKRRAAAPGQIAQAREIFTVELNQRYSTVQRAAQVDPQYSSSENNFSPIVLSVRAMPSVDFNATVRAEFDSRYRELRTIHANGSYSWSSRVQSNVGWSKRAFIEELAGFNNPDSLDHSLNGSSTVRTRDNKYGSIYSFNYDVLRSAMVQQRISGFYNAQCCGIAFELQRYNFGASSTLPADNRFFLSFTLAGLGNFAPFSGGMSGVPR